MSPVERVKTREKLVFASIMGPSEGEITNAILFAESIRAFAGAFSKVPIWFFTPELEKEIATDVKTHLTRLNVNLITFQLDSEVLESPFAGQVFAKALAEMTAVSQTKLLAWMNTNSMILKEPSEFLLDEGKSLGYRPVHHTLIGSRFEEPLDAFWTQIYDYCRVPEERVFPMAAHVDGENLRPYFNAGILVTRPENQLFRRYRDCFLKVYKKPEFLEFYRQDSRYAVFMHQAVLSGVILSALPSEVLQELSSDYNYPIHLHSEDITDHRPEGMDEMVTCRHEGFHTDSEWAAKIPAGDFLKQWIANHLV
ncbi:MAG: hypothetical protein ACW98Y_02005 [Candidatus Thorarchaeota archaeon]|jgi:hypothetical protein